jgi:hypothetical protein
MLHVLDVAMNAVTAQAKTVKVSVRELPEQDRLCLLVADNGPGMAPDLVQAVLQHYATTKRKQTGWVGFGLALLRGTVELCDGRFDLLSRPGVGTLVSAEMPYSHPDRPPLGQVAESLQTLLVGTRGVDFCLTHRVRDRSYRLDTRSVRRAMPDEYDTQTVRTWLVGQLREGESALASGRQGNDSG